MHTEKHWASKQANKQDEVRDFFARGLDFALRRKKDVAIAVGAAALLIGILGFVAYSRSVNENEAWDKLAMAEAYSYYGRPKEAGDALADVAGQTSSPAAAGLAGMIQGELKQANGEHDAAVAAFTRAAETAPEPLKPFALADKVAAYETAGKNAECVASAQSFLDANADHFLAPQIMEIMARCQAASGQDGAARATWQKITLQYDKTPWAARANARLNPPTK